MTLFNIHIVFEKILPKLTEFLFDNIMFFNKGLKELLIILQDLLLDVKYVTLLNIFDLRIIFINGIENIPKILQPNSINFCLSRFFRKPSISASSSMHQFLT